MGIRYISDVLYHFVGLRHPTDHEANYSTLLKILDAKAVTHAPHELRPRVRNYKWSADMENGEPIIPQITCYCDIPYEALKLHLQRYGSFGISFPRNFLVIKGARPVTYVPLQSKDYYPGDDNVNDHSMLRDWIDLRNAFDEHFVQNALPPEEIRKLGVKPDSSLTTILAMDDFLTNNVFAFIKAFDANLTDDGPQNFYMEREWRMFGNLTFEPEDIANVLVNDKYITRLAHERPEYAGKIIPAPL